MEPLRIGLVGAGSIAQVAHLPILTTLPDACLGGICDIDSSKLKTIADRYKPNVVATDYNEFVGRGDIDALIIATTTDSHLPIGKAALLAGKPVLIEKPIGRSVEEANQLAEIARDRDLILMVGMNHRFRQDIISLKNFIRSGNLGRIFLIKAAWLNYQSSNQQWVRRLEQSGGGVLLDLGIVMLDIVLWLLDFPTVKTVSANTYHHQTQLVEDSASCFIRLQDECIVSLDVSWTATVEDEQYSCEILGTKGSAKINPLRIHKVMAGHRVNVTPVLSDSPQTHFKKSYEQEIKHFVSAIRGTHPLTSSGEESVYPMKIVDAIYLSANKGREIAL